MDNTTEVLGTGKYVRSNPIATKYIPMPFWSTSFYLSFPLFI